MSTTARLVLMPVGVCVRLASDSSSMVLVRIRFSACRSGKYLNTVLLNYMEKFQGRTTRFAFAALPV